ncbi:MAG: P1 family peptidase, partial [Gemmatimonadota bacterium]|nr:P1 family peptidase [Gemmatimonadota bacterium]
MTAAPDFTPFGLAIGHATEQAGGTGLTVVRGIDAPFRAAASIFGRATGTRELDALSPEHLVDRVDAILLTGGSAFGLGAADGVMRWMEERGRGFSVSVGVVPIVPAAVVFDLAPCGRVDARPTPDMAYAACESARPLVELEGSVGAGTGTTVGKGAGSGRAMKGGVGAWVESGVGANGAIRVGAIAVVNALGDVRDASGAIIAGARADDGGFVDIARAVAAGVPPAPSFAQPPA